MTRGGTCVDKTRFTWQDLRYRPAELALPRAPAGVSQGWARAGAARLGGGPRAASELGEEKEKEGEVEDEEKEDERQLDILFSILGGTAALEALPSQKQSLMVGTMRKKWENQARGGDDQQVESSGLSARGTGDEPGVSSGSRSAQERSSEEVSGGEQDQNANSSEPPRKKRYHRHTLQQREEMEMVFRECQHPDEKQRQQLSEELGLEPKQVKFWFQNRRTQHKAQHERSENMNLRAEVDKLQRENRLLREAVKNAPCSHCSGGQNGADFDCLQEENARLKEQISTLTSVLASQMAEPGPELSLASSNSNGGDAFNPTVSGLSVPLTTAGASAPVPAPLQTSLPPASSRPMSYLERELLIQQAMRAMDELVRMAQSDEPLWIQGQEGRGETLNLDEYSRLFPTRRQEPSWVVEATRGSGHVMISATALVEIFMDVNCWMEMFPCIVKSSVVIEILSPGSANGNRDGALQLMSAETQILSPLVQTRKATFLRYCKQLPEGYWGIVDFSTDGYGNNPSTGRLERVYRRPSGCIIQDDGSRCSKVTMVEHAEADHQNIHNLCAGVVRSGAAFGAMRWLGILQHQCIRAACQQNPPAGQGVPGISIPGQRSMLKLAQRMTRSFCEGVSASKPEQWTTLTGTGSEDVRVMVRKSETGPREPHGIILSAATTLWLSTSPEQVFDFLHDNRRRCQWDILCNGEMVTEIARINKGHDARNDVSLLKVQAPITQSIFQAPSSQSNNVMLIVQESSWDDFCSMVVYAPVDTPAMTLVMGGGNPDFVALLPSGFAIIPDGLPDLGSPGGGILNAGLGLGLGGPRLGVVGLGGQAMRNGGVGLGMRGMTKPTALRRGSLLTIAFQILVSNAPQEKLSFSSITTVSGLISCTVAKIKAALEGPQES